MNDNKNLFSEEQLSHLHAELRYREESAFDRLMNLLPDCKKNNLMNIDPSVKSFLYLLKETNDPYTVLDVLLVHLATLNNKYDTLRKSIIMNIPAGMKIEDLL